MMKAPLIAALLWACAAESQPLAPSGTPPLERPPYAVPDGPWSIQLGHHRAVVRVWREGEALFVRIPWRRRDDNPAAKRIIAMDSASGRPVGNIFRVRVEKEFSDLVFQPVAGKGTYFFYYLPYRVQMMWGWYEGDYLTPEALPQEDWVARNRLRPMIDGEGRSDLAGARVIRLESRTPFDSFFPMEVPASAREVRSLLTKNEDPYLVFPEDRLYPIRMRGDIPLRWVDAGPSGRFRGRAARNEYYAFQLGVFACRRRLDSLFLAFTPLRGETGSIVEGRMTCFNLGGIDARGRAFVKRVDVDSGAVQALWIGVDVGPDVRAGTYEGILTLGARNAPAKRIRLALSVSDTFLADRGDAEPWRHSRLRWLNSTAGSEETVVPPYAPVELTGRRVRILGREIETGHDGFPAQIATPTDSLLARPIRLVAMKDGMPLSAGVPRLSLSGRSPAQVIWISRSAGETLSMTVEARAEFDGYIAYRATITAERDVALDDLRMEMPLRASAAGYFMGMGKEGCLTPEWYDWVWRGPQDSYWIGNPDVGLHCELRGGTYHGPLLNLYHPPPPPTWNNGGRGGFSLRREEAVVRVAAFTGPLDLRRGDSLALEFALLITPVKPVDFSSQFRDRYYHAIAPGPEDLAAGVTVMNVHHSYAVNPFINYPFLRTDTLRAFVEGWHRRGMKVKIYYTVRELTNAATELWALRSLGEEVLAGGKGGGYPWLREHLEAGYAWAWYNPFDDSTADAAIVTAGESRWYNYYIEGLEWLVRNTDIDGLYLDDVTYDRQILQRMRRVMARAKPGCVIDLHSNTGFSIGPANQYTGFFPYVDKLWFGESFHYDAMSAANWLVEVSGIPFGLTGDMLQGCGNPWRGMVYGMTVRHPWVTDGIQCDPRPIWRVWDSVGIDTLEVSGYWKRDTPIRTDRENVKATLYHGRGTLLVALASWEEDTVDVQIQIDFPKIGIDPSAFTFSLPTVKNLQEGGRWSPDLPLRLAPRRGAMIIGQRKR